MGRLVLAGLLGLLGTAWLFSCAPDLGAVPFLCNSGKPQCPDGYTCKANHYCVKEGTCPDSIPGCVAPDTCGNGVCDVGEDTDNCGQDCTGGDCGNDTCDEGETAETCPKDCHCGDGTCGTGETPDNCAADCPTTGCGDGKCVSPETHKSCPGDCPIVCGDSVCDSGETNQSCPKDCPAAVCGNGKCETGETATSCASDCANCTNNATACDGTDKLKTCVGSTWQTQDCNTYCTSKGKDYSAGCSYSSAQARDVCDCGDYVGFGDLCDDLHRCEPSLFCGVFGSASQGFCTKYCTADSGCSGEPDETYATCTLNVGGQSACAFECDLFTECPSDLYCDDWAGICKP